MATHKGAEHHKKAAQHHELAAKHHQEAAKHHEAGSYEKAAHHSEIAAGHGLHAVYHTEEATKHHAEEHTGKGVAAPLQSLRPTRSGTVAGARHRQSLGPRFCAYRRRPCSGHSSIPVPCKAVARKREFRIEFVELGYANGLHKYYSAVEASGISSSSNQGGE